MNVDFLPTLDTEKIFVDGLPFFFFSSIMNEKKQQQQQHHHTFFSSFPFLLEGKERDPSE